MAIASYSPFEVVAQKLEAMAAAVRRLDDSSTLETSSPIAETTKAEPPAGKLNKQAKNMKLTGERFEKAGVPKKAFHFDPDTKPKNLRTRVLEYLQSHADGNAIDISSEVSASAGHVSQALSALLGQGRVIRYSRGQYKIDPDWTE